ncbi:CBS domain-containing protein [Balamuthia mandrillaris]
MAQNALYEHLHQLKISDILNPKAGSVVFVTSDNTVEETVRVLGSNSIQSCAVVEASSQKEKQQEVGSCVGVVDVLDIVSFIVSVAPDAASITRNELQSLEICGRAIAFEPIVNVINASGRDPYVPLLANDPVTMLTDIFAKGIHRMPILDDGQRLSHTISQSDVVQYLSTQLHMGKLKGMGEKTCKQLFGLDGQREVFTVSKNGSSLLDALKMLKEKGVSALAVVEEDGTLAGNFSASDLKGLYQEQFPSLLLPVGDYLEKHSPKVRLFLLLFLIPFYFVAFCWFSRLLSLPNILRFTQQSLQPICASAETSLLDLTKEMAASRIHRMWVLDESYRPIGVISMTDIMNLIHQKNL